MKIIKLNRRFKQFKDHGHTVGFRFDQWDVDARNVEQILRSLSPSGGCTRTADWYSYFGKARYSISSRPYFITLRDDKLVSLVLLMIGNGHESLR